MMPLEIYRNEIGNYILNIGELMLIIPSEEFDVTHGTSFFWGNFHFILGPKIKVSEYA